MTPSLGAGVPIRPADRCGVVPDARRAADPHVSEAYERIVSFMVVTDQWSRPAAAAVGRRHRTIGAEGEHMTISRPRPAGPVPIVTRPWPVRRPVRGSALARILRTTDAKQIGILYLVTSFMFFIVAGFMALLMRAELARPGLQFLSTDQYNQLFTVHGGAMLLLFATPVLFAFANYIVPLQIGAPDVAFPRLNAFAYWLYLFGGLMVAAGFLTP